MRVTCESTPEMELYVINGVEVPARVWVGVSECGRCVRLLVLGVIELSQPVPELALISSPAPLA